MPQAANAAPLISTTIDLSALALVVAVLLSGVTGAALLTKVDHDGVQRAANSVR